MTAPVTEILEDAWGLVCANLPQTLALRHDVLWKPDGSPVTKADHFHESLLGDLLHQRLPGLVLVAEESDTPPHVPDAEWVAVLDPIDGTENFCSGLKEWGVALSLWCQGEHAGSALMLPEMGDVLISGQLPPPFPSRIVGLSSSYNSEIGQAIAQNPESRIMGCAVYNAYNVIRGSFARFYNPKGAWCWDLQAGICLAVEAGCDVLINERPYDGTLLAPDKRHRVDIRHRYDLHPGQGSVGR